VDHEHPGPGLYGPGDDPGGDVESRADGPDLCPPLDDEADPSCVLPVGEFRRGKVLQLPDEAIPLHTYPYAGDAYRGIYYYG
jgi:hypothetical protein